MDMDFVLASVFLVFLTLLVMIFGEKLSVLGAFHGRWISSLSDLIADLWDFVCDAADQAWCFVVDHLWWVLAVGSGSTGVILVGWLMFGGVAEQAAADIADSTGLLNAGGILDAVPQIDSKTILTRGVRTDSDDLTKLVYQVPSRVRSIAPPVVLQPQPEPEFEEPVIPRWEPPVRDRVRPSWPALSDLPDRPERLPWENRRDDLLREERDLLSMSIERVVDDTDSMTETTGQPVDSIALRESIDRAISGLRTFNSDWKEYDRYSVWNPEGDNNIDSSTDFTEVPEASSWELRDIEDRVKLVPGTSVADTDLRIEKRVAAGSVKRAFEIEIEITNTSLDRMSGLVVREYLQAALQPVSIDGNGLYRDSTITWVVNDLDPLDMVTLRFQVRADRAREFESETEISAVTAVRTQIEVRSRRRTESPATGSPDVRMLVEEPGRQVDVLENLEIPILLRNVGDGTAEMVVIRVTLPLELDHHQLDENDLKRELSINVRDLNPNETRTIPLRIRATEAGSHRATVDLIEQRQRLDRVRLTIEARPRDRSPVDSPRLRRDNRTQSQ
jgi:hypothetical protein